MSRTYRHRHGHLPERAVVRDDGELWFGVTSARDLASAIAEEQLYAIFSTEELAKMRPFAWSWRVHVKTWPILRRWRQRYRRNPLKNERQEYRRALQRRYRAQERQALAHGEEMPRWRRTEGWFTW